MDTTTTAVVVRRSRRRGPVRHYPEELHIFTSRFSPMVHIRCVRPCWCGAE